MKTYVGNWSVNNGGTYSSGYEDTNKRRLARDMREMADGNVFAGSTGYWAVYELVDGTPDVDPVLSGKVIG